MKYPVRDSASQRWSPFQPCTPSSSSTNTLGSPVRVPGFGLFKLSRNLTPLSYHRKRRRRDDNELTPPAKRQYVDRPSWLNEKPPSDEEWFSCDDVEMVDISDGGTPPRPISRSAKSKSNFTRARIRRPRVCCLKTPKPFTRKKSRRRSLSIDRARKRLWPYEESPCKRPRLSESNFEYVNATSPMAVSKKKRSSFFRRARRLSVPRCPPEMPSHNGKNEQAQMPSSHGKNEQAQMPSSHGKNEQAQMPSSAGKNEQAQTPCSHNDPEQAHEPEPARANDEKSGVEEPETKNETRNIPRQRRQSVGSDRSRASKREILTAREMKAKLDAMGVETRGLEKQDLLDLLRKPSYATMRRRSQHETKKNGCSPKRRVDQAAERQNEVFRILNTGCPWAILKLDPRVCHSADLDMLIKKQYRTLSKLCHPDKASSQLRSHATAAFQMMEKATQEVRRQAMVSRAYSDAMRNFF